MYWLREPQVPYMIFLFGVSEAVRMMNMAIQMFEDIGRLSMAAKHYKVII